MLLPQEVRLLMATSSPDPKSNGTSQQRLWRRRLIQWGPFVFLGVLCVLLFWGDDRLKRSDHAGFVPQGAEWKVVAADLPQLWSQWENVPATTLLQELAPPFMHEGAVAIRKLTGVRPTPSRLRLWLGHGAVLAGNGTNWCLSLRPGIALRMVSMLHGLTAEAPRPEIRLWGDLAYGWRGGFLLVAPSADYLADVLQSGDKLPRDAVPPDALSLSWEGGRPGSLRVHAQDGFPFDLELSGITTAPNAPLRYTHGWPEAMVVLDSNNADTIAALRTTMDTQVARLLPPTVRNAWETLAAEWWSAQIPPVPFPACGDERAWVIFAPEDSEENGSLRIGQRQHGCGPKSLKFLEGLDNARPYRWDDRAGWLYLSPQHAASWSAAEDRDSVAWGTDPTLVPKLLNVPAAAPVSAIFFLRARWEPIVRQGRELLLDLAEQDLIPNYNAADIRAHWLPYLDAFAEWDALEATGDSRNGTLHIRGHLTTPGMD